MTAWPPPDPATVVPGDCRVTLAGLPAGVFQTCVTSIPYYGLRSYSTEPQVWGGDRPGCVHVWDLPIRPHHPGQVAQTKDRSGAVAEGQNAPAGQFCTRCTAWRGEYGSEPTVDLYVAHTVEVFRAVRRVLRPDGTLWLNIGDCYSNAGRSGGAGQVRARHKPGWTADTGIGEKQLLLLPARVALALQADGWTIRSEIIWAKLNPLPESVTDRPTKAHEQIYLCVPEPHYYYDQEAVRETISPSTIERWGTDQPERKTSKPPGPSASTLHIPGESTLGCNPAGRNLRDVWPLSSQSYNGAHFATFPEAIPRRAIQAGTSARGGCSVCGAPWRRDKQRKIGYNGNYERLSVPPVPANATEGSLCNGLAEEGRTAAGVPGMRRDQAAGPLEYEARPGTRASEAIPGDSRYGTIRLQATVSGDSARQGTNAGPQSGVSPERAGAGNGSGLSPRLAPHRGAADSGAHPVQQATGQAEGRPRDIHSNGLGADPNSTEPSLQVLQSPLYSEPAPDYRPCDSLDEGRGAQPREYRSRLQAVQLAEVESDGDAYEIIWRPTCSCGCPAGMAPDDWEEIETPTGERAAPDPSLATGRAGYNRPRGPAEGSRPITRYEQRRYAAQLRNSPHRDAMAAEAGSAFDHYLRTDRSGARPVPPDLLTTWLARGWLDPVVLPEWTPPPPTPQFVLDPFAGTGTTLAVARSLGRHAFGCELQPAYLPLSARRIAAAPVPLPALVEHL